ncbi:unnamed protein product [Toxocara canis]|uniref:DDE_Tnp_1_7 domain-containing protein n=1 Tax=Toxocara canis TaxID=6265 RepID=A0A183V774_TOXCA|nr:unnamed protein product [Toxocara canis]
MPDEAQLVSGKCPITRNWYDGAKVVLRKVGIAKTYDSAQMVPGKFPIIRSWYRESVRLCAVDTGYGICTASRLVHSAASSRLPAKRLWNVFPENGSCSRVEESMPKDVTCEDEKGGSPVDVVRYERSNWEYGPSGEAATRRRRRRRKRYALHQIDDTKGTEENGEAYRTNQMEDYVVEDDWNLKAVSNCTRKTDNDDAIVKLNLGREPGATVAETENGDDVVSLPDENRGTQSIRWAQLRECRSTGHWVCLSACPLVGIRVRSPPPPVTFRCGSGMCCPPSLLCASLGCVIRSSSAATSATCT